MKLFWIFELRNIYNIDIKNYEQFVLNLYC